MLDEMYLQQEVQYDGRELTGCDSNLQMYKSILCFMVVSLKQSTPYIKANTLTRINNQIVQDGIINCVNILSSRDFYVRAVVSDNRSTNVSAYKHLKALHPCSIRNNAIANPLNPDKYIYLIFDTVQLVKKFGTTSQPPNCSKYQPWKQLLWISPLKLHQDLTIVNFSSGT